MIPPPESDDVLFEQLCGREFAAGEHRTIHDVIGHPDMVMKAARYSHFANWSEYLISSALEPHSTEVRVGYVASISASGRFLLMERLTDVVGSLAGVVVPRWLNDVKRSTFGVSGDGLIKVRDYGLLKLGDQLGSQQYICEEERTSVPRRVPSGEDGEFAALMGLQVGHDGARAVHEMLGDETLVVKVCNGSHKENASEWIIYSALASIDAMELSSFAFFECSRTGKYVLTDRLRNITADFHGHRPDFPWWLDDDGRVLGVATESTAKIRRWADAALGEVLIRTPTYRIA